MNALQKPNQFTIIPIDDDIPMPAGNALPRGVLPYAVLKVGQSFAFPDGYEASKAYKSTTNATRRLKPKVFRTRKLENEVRCWRVS